MGSVPSELAQLRVWDLFLYDNRLTCIPQILVDAQDRMNLRLDDLPLCATGTDSTAAADFDGDGVVGFSDFFLFAEAFGGSDPRFDLDDSGVVDFADFFLFTESFGQPAREKLLALAREMIGLPDGPQRLQNAPNPFNSRTVISYFLFDPGPVRLQIYNALGQPVRSLVDEFQVTGFHQVSWDARDERAAEVAAGVYIARLSYPGGLLTRRLLHLK